MATMKNGRKIGILAAVVRAITSIFSVKPDTMRHGRSSGQGRMAFYAISDPKHQAHRRNWAH